MASKDAERLRLGGMALRNGLLIHGPTHWSAAVRDRDGRSRSPPRASRSWRPKLVARLPGLRGPLKLAEAMAVLPLARRRLPAARLPFENWQVIAATGATLARPGCCASGRRPRPCARASPRWSAPCPRWWR